MRTQALRIVTWRFLSTRAHNYVKIAVSKGIYTTLTESVQNPRCTGETSACPQSFLFSPNYASVLGEYQFFWEVFPQMNKAFLYALVLYPRHQYDSPDVD